MGNYDDILHLPHHVSPTRKRMTMTERAAQFSPFAALVGYEGAVRETARLTDQRMDLSEDEKAMIDRKQQVILAALECGENPTITVTFFRPDAKKNGGEYVDYTGEVKKVEQIRNALIFMDGMEIPCSDVLDLSSDLFSQLF